MTMVFNLHAWRWRGGSMSLSPNNQRRFKSIVSEELLKLRLGWQRRAGGIMADRHNFFKKVVSFDGADENEAVLATFCCHRHPTSCIKWRENIYSLTDAACCLQQEPFSCIRAMRAICGRRNGPEGDGGGRGTPRVVKIIGHFFGGMLVN